MGGIQNLAYVLGILNQSNHRCESCIVVYSGVRPARVHYGRMPYLNSINRQEMEVLESRVNF